MVCRYGLVVVLLLCGAAAAQVMVIGGTASNWTFGPFVPVVRTPEMSLDPPPFSMPARTAGNTSQTLGLINDNVFAMPYFYSGLTSWYSAPGYWYPSAMGQGPIAVAHEGEPGAEARPFEMGIAHPNDPHTLVTASKRAKSAPKASRTYTNQDIEHLK